MSTTLETIVHTVCRHMGLELSEIRTTSDGMKFPRRIAARRLVSFLAYKHAGVRFDAIGHTLGGGRSTAHICEENARELIEAGGMLTPGHPCDRFIDVVHDIERALGLPLTPEPEHAEV